MQDFINICRLRSCRFNWRALCFDETRSKALANYSLIWELGCDTCNSNWYLIHRL